MNHFTLKKSISNLLHTNRLNRITAQIATQNCSQRLFQATVALALLFQIGLFNSVTWAANPFLDKAEALLKAGDGKSAKAVYIAYLKKDPGNLTAQIGLANIAIRSLEFSAAESLLQQTLATHPNSALTVASLGYLFSQWSVLPGKKDNTRDYHAMAGEYFNQAIQMNDKNPAVLTAIANWQIQEGNTIEAEQLLQKITREQPTYVPALQAFCKLYLSLKDIPRARDCVFYAIDSDPGNSDSYFLVAQLMARTDHPAEAVQYAKKSELLDFGTHYARNELLAKQYEKLGESQNAILYYQALLKVAPNHAPFLMKMGQLAMESGQKATGITYYQKALKENPATLTQLLSEARESSRLEQIELARSRWEQLIMMQPNNPPLIGEALGQLAGLHYLDWFYHPDKPAGIPAKLKTLFDYGDKNSLACELDLIKLSIASDGKTTPATDQRLARLMDNQNPAISGEAAFLRGDYARANALLELVDGISDNDLLQLADRLLLDQELKFSQAFYQRVNQLSPNEALNVPIARIEKKIALAKEKSTKGDAAYAKKDYQEAITHYASASKVYRQWDNIYLKLGNTYEQLKEWHQAKTAYDMAGQLSPSLLRSEGFAKHYKKIQKKADKADKNKTGKQE
jgi:Tfp pilus assembly protein PilF